MFIKEKIRKIKKWCLQNTIDFCQNTTFHGLKYVGNHDLHMMQRTFFGISIVVVLLLACYFITQIYTKWMNNPIIFGMNPKPNFITDEPFPAVTICNMHQVMKPNVEHFSNDSLEYAKLQFVCNLKKEVNIPEESLREDELIAFLTNVSQPCNRMIIDCVYGGVRQNCTDIFQLVVTSQGVCCVFNMLHPMYMYASRIPTVLKYFTMGNVTPVNWNAEFGYPKHLPKHFFPRKTHGTGEALGFQVILNGENENFYCSTLYSAGFKILLHNPSETPNVQEMGLLISPGRQTKIRITPEKVQTSPNLRNVDRRYRSCLFEGEMKLQYFAHYTQRNCEMECKARVMFRYCGCITFYLPILENDGAICGTNKSDCVESVELRGDRKMEFCLNSCLPSCSDFTFYADISMAHLRDVDMETEERNFTEDYVKQNVAVVNMYFKEYMFRSAIQTEFVGTADFLSNVGGLMSLFFGFSIFSILEIFYFAILRPLQNFFRKKSAKSSRKKLRSAKVSSMLNQNINFSRRQLKQALWAEYAHNSFRPKTPRTIRRDILMRAQISAEICSDILS